MAEILPVSLNGDRMHAVEAVPSFETAGSFVVRLESNGTPAHVHLHVDDALSTVASLDTNNHYVEDACEVTVAVAGGDRPVKGVLEITTGYGANTERVAVTVIEPQRGTHYVDVDERFNAPPSREAPEETGRAISGGTVVLVALAVLALAIALWTATAIGSTAVAVGAAIVVCGVAAAVYFLVA